MTKNLHILFSLFLLFISCSHTTETNPQQSESSEIKSDSYLIVLGTAQDGGYPQAGCKKECCKLYWEGKEKKRFVSSLGIVDKKSGKAWMFDATPDFREQYEELVQKNKVSLEGIFLTHAHVGHYTGIMQLGREVMGCDSVKVYTMPKMKNFLEHNGPWAQLVTLNNISLQKLANDSSVKISDEISVTPILVPHRDEYSETVGYKIESKNKKILFIPDINKWDIWDKNIVDEIKNSDIAFLDATFYKDGEISRSMSEVPHPFIEESMELFKALTEEEKAKVYFIHFNHTNPVIRDSKERNDVIQKGFHCATENMRIAL